METIFINTENRESNELHKFVLNLLQRNSNKHVALYNLSISYTCKNIIKEYKNLKISAPT